MVEVKSLGKIPLLPDENVIFITSPICRVEFDPKSKVVKEIVLLVKSISDCLNVVISWDLSWSSNKRLKSSSSISLLNIPFFSAWAPRLLILDKPYLEEAQS